MDGRPRRPTVCLLALATGLLGLQACDADDISPRSGLRPAPAQHRRYAAVGVVQEGPDDVMLCLGGGTGRPDSCGGAIPIRGWDWTAVTDEERDGEWTSGVYYVSGAYDGRVLSVEEARAPTEADFPPTWSGLETHCPEPEGGWAASKDPARLGHDRLRALMAAAKDDPAFAGLWFDHPNERPRPGASEEAISAGRGVDRGTRVINVRFTADVARHRRELSSLWGGALCVTGARHTTRELEQIQRGLPTLERDLGLDLLSSSVDVSGNVVEAEVVVIDPAQRAAVGERYGDAVRLLPQLRPVR